MKFYQPKATILNTQLRYCFEIIHRKRPEYIQDEPNLYHIMCYKMWEIIILGGSSPKYLPKAHSKSYLHDNFTMHEIYLTSLSVLYHCTCADNNLATIYSANIEIYLRSYQ